MQDKSLLFQNTQGLVLSPQSEHILNIVKQYDKLQCADDTVRQNA